MSVAAGPSKSSCLRRFLAARRGSTVVEFALIAAPFIALMIASLNVAIVFFSNELLETAAEGTSRLIMTGQAQSGNLTQAQLKQKACAMLPSFLSCGSLMMDVRKATSFSAVSTTTPTITFDKNGNVTNTWSYDMGGSGAIVIVRLMYIWPTALGPFGVDFGNVGTGQRLLIATTVSKTEPY